MIPTFPCRTATRSRTCWLVLTFEDSNKSPADCKIEWRLCMLTSRFSVFESRTNIATSAQCAASWPRGGTDATSLIGDWRLLLWQRECKKNVLTNMFSVTQRDCNNGAFYLTLWKRDGNSVTSFVTASRFCEREIVTRVSCLTFPVW